MVRQTTTETTLVEHRGPLPAPETLQKYNSIFPGLADRIVCMAEREQANRISTNQDAVVIDPRTGAVFFFPLQPHHDHHDHHDDKRRRGSGSIGHIPRFVQKSALPLSLSFVLFMGLLPVSSNLLALRGLHHCQDAGLHYCGQPVPGFDHLR